MSNTFYAIHFQVQLQEETLEEDKARPVNMRVAEDPLPSPSTSAGTSSWGLVMGREPCYLEQLFCTDTLVMLMFDNKKICDQT